MGASGDRRGRAATRPGEIPAPGLGDVLSRVRAEMKADQLSLLSAGIAFYSLLALVPALVALLSVYGLVADPNDVRRQVLDALEAAPREVREFVSGQLESIVGASSGGTIVAVVFGTLAALWSASSGVDHLIDALNVAYDESEDRGWVRRKLLAVGFTLSAMTFVVVAIAIIAFLPNLLDRVEVDGFAATIVGGVRWLVLLGGMMAGLSALYRWGPDRADAKWRWVTPGAVAAAVIWLAGSVGFSIYAANFASYNETYGSLGAIVVVMLWLYLTALSILLGAEINCELERQTAVDTTTGKPRRLGTRAAYAADTVGVSAKEVAHRDQPADNGRDTSDALSVRGPVEPGGIAAADLPLGRTPPGCQPLPMRGLTGVCSRLFGVRVDRAFAVVTGDQVTVRYGSWVLTTTCSNVTEMAVTGPYRWWRVAGPPRLSWGDRGVTLATNRDSGLMIAFASPVACLLPFGLWRHQTLTVTVADPSALMAAIAAARGAADGVPQDL